jgi:hypothetical protein
MLSPRRAQVFRWLTEFLVLAGFACDASALSSAPHHALVNEYCLSCHNDRAKTAGPRARLGQHAGAG